MMYRLLRWAARVALRWFYRELEVSGAEHIAVGGPLLIAGNHPNALVDALVIAVVLDRPVTLTAKATIFEHPLLRTLLRTLPIIPLRRASDERTRGGAALDPGRNREAFRAILDTLEESGAVLIFPEGRSHSESQLAPLRSGLSRIALQSRSEGRAEGLSILPVGLTFEMKWKPRTRVLVQIGRPIAVAEWPATPDALTSLVDARLRAVTLNFPSLDDAEQVLRVSRLLSSLSDSLRPLATPDAPLEDMVDIARRVEAAWRRLQGVPDELGQRAQRFLERLRSFESTLEERGISPADIPMTTGLAAAARFLVRETLIFVLAAPLALWGRINHWIPLRLASSLAHRPGDGPDEPAMRLIALGFGLVLLAYTVQTVIVAAVAGPIWAAAYLLSLPPSASWDFRLRDRGNRAHQRVRTWLQLRGDAGVRDRLQDEAKWISEEAAALERLLTHDCGATMDAPGPRPVRVVG